jgi:hypothetical protein
MQKPLDKGGYLISAHAQANIGVTSLLQNPWKNALYKISFNNSFFAILSTLTKITLLDLLD